MAKPMNPDARKEYYRQYIARHPRDRRANVLAAARSRRQLPKAATIERYAFTREELETVFERIVGACAQAA